MVNTDATLTVLVAEELRSLNQLAASFDRSCSNRSLNLMFAWLGTVAWALVAWITSPGHSLWDSGLISLAVMIVALWVSSVWYSWRCRRIFADIRAQGLKLQLAGMTVYVTSFGSLHAAVDPSIDEGAPLDFRSVGAEEFRRRVV